MLVLIMMQVFTIFGLCGIQMAFLEFKRSSSSWERHQLEYLIEKMLTKIETNLSSCFIPMSLSTELLDKLKSSECKGKYQGMEYHYGVELMGEDPCAIIPVSAKKLVARYFRISLWGRLGHSQMLAQSTFVTPIESEKSCDNHCHFISPGRQSWREMVNEMVNKE